MKSNNRMGFAKKAYRNWQRRLQIDNLRETKLNALNVLLTCQKNRAAIMDG